MQLTSKYNKGLLFLCVVDIFSKYAWVVPLKDKKGITSNNVFPKNSDEFNQKPNKMWLGHGCMDDIETYSRYNERESCVGGRFIRALKNKIYKYMTSTSKGVYIDNLDDMVNESNNTYHKTTKMIIPNVNS